MCDLDFITLCQFQARPWKAWQLSLLVSWSPKPPYKPFSHPTSQDHVEREILCQPEESHPSQQRHQQWMKPPHTSQPQGSSWWWWLHRRPSVRRADENYSPFQARKYLLLFSFSVMSDSVWLHGLQQARLPCPLLPPAVCSNWCPLSQGYHPAISFSVAFFSCLQSFPALGSFPMSQLFASGGQSIGTSASASILPMNQFSSVQSFSCVCTHSMDQNMPGLPVHHQLPEFTQTHVH